MKIPRFLLIPFLLFSVIAMAQESGEHINIRLSNEGFTSFVQQVETQSSFVLYFKSIWLEGKNFSYRADSVLVEDALYEVLKGTGLHFNRVGAYRLIILPEKRLNMSLPVMATVAGRYQESEEGEEFMGVKADQYLTGTRPEQITRTIEVGSHHGGPCLGKGKCF
jgi:hypothetical protein